MMRVLNSSGYAGGMKLSDAQQSPIRFLTAESEGWQDLGANPQLFNSIFARILTSRHLLVLSGLGTSRCIELEEGAPLAPTMADLWTAVKAANAETFSQVLASIEWGKSSENVELLLSRCAMEEELRPNDQLKQFIAAGEKAIAKSCNFITPETELGVHELFLRKIARRSTKLPRAQIFTTNYDLAFETAAARIGFAVIDGFSATSPSQFDPVAFDRDLARRDLSDPAKPIDWVPNVMQLHKLHGSIDWLDANGVIQRGTPGERPVIIYPRSNKFEASYQQPFLELMSRYQAGLRREGTGLMVAGSGFEDRHLAEPFLAAVRGNIGINIVVASRSLEKKQDRVSALLKKLIASGDRRISLVAASFEELVPALPDLVAPTEGEIHGDRVVRAEAGAGGD
jgi:SIR2-like domain